MTILSNFIQAQMNTHQCNHERPEVAVLLPVYNGEAFIAEAVKSILQQSYTNFELLIMDDGSTDGTGRILASLAAQDPRIRVHSRENRGLIATLNEGLALCSSEFVARMDADDYALPHRLATQYAYMTTHKEVAVCSAGIEEYETGRILSWEGYGEAVRVRLLFGCCLYHPTVMARRSALLSVGGYDTSVPCAEDYDLWVRLAEAGYVLATLPQVLLRYRTHPQVSRAGYKWQMNQTTSHIQQRLLTALNVTPTRRQIDRHQFCISGCPETSKMLDEAKKWLRQLVKANEYAKVYDQEVFLQTLGEIEKKFVDASWQRDPGQYAQRVLRNMFKECLYTLNLKTEGERWITAIAQRMNLFFQHRKQ